MDSLPNFHDPTLFPAFSSIPLAPAPAAGPPNVSESPPSSLQSPYYLIGTISQNMTLSTNPTFICADRNSVPFAVTIKLDSSAAKFDVKACKKGYVMAVLNAKKSGVKEGKQGFVNTVPGEVTIIPTSVDKLLEMSNNAKTIQSSADSKCCQACTTERKVDQLSRCKGCEAVWYCNKTCQTSGWQEKGHKGECKVLKAMRGMREDATIR